MAIGAKDKRQVTAIPIVTASGIFDWYTADLSWKNNE